MTSYPSLASQGHSKAFWPGLIPSLQHPHNFFVPSSSIYLRLQLCRTTGHSLCFSTPALLKLFRLSEVELLNLVYKITEGPVNFESQTHNEYIFSISISLILHVAYCANSKMSFTVYVKFKFNWEPWVLSDGANLKRLFKGGLSPPEAFLSAFSTPCYHSILLEPPITYKNTLAFF